MAFRVVTPSGDVLADNALSVERDVEAQGEVGLIKVVMGEGEFDFFYIGHGKELNDTYDIVEV